MRLPLGKVPLDILQKHILRFHGYISSDVVVGPSVGLDFAVVKLDDRYLIVASDPVTGVEEDIGWYAVNVSANDVATSGARPRFLSAIILLPEGSDESLARKVAEQIDEAARSLQIAVTGGHTEVTPGLRRVIVVTTAFGLTSRYITAGDIEEGDVILMTKTAGIEGTSILARRFRDRLKALDSETLRKASDMVKQISVVEDAATLFATEKIHAMHDPTEGGVVGGVYEMALASDLGFRLFTGKIAVAPETSAVCSRLGVDPSRLVGSGCLLAAADPREADFLLNHLERHGVRGTVIGRFGGRGRELVNPDGSVEEVEPTIVDELWRLNEG